MILACENTKTKDARLLFEDQPVIQCRSHLRESLRPDVTSIFSSSIPGLTNILSGGAGGLEILTKTGPGRISPAEVMNTLLTLTHADRIARTCAYMILSPGGFHSVGSGLQMKKPEHPSRATGLIQPIFSIEGLSAVSGVSIRNQRLIFSWLEARGITLRLTNARTFSEHRYCSVDEGYILLRDVFYIKPDLFRNFIL